MKKVLSLMAVLLFLAFPIHATVTDTESPVKVYTSATVTAYPIPFDYIDDEDIEVTLVAIATSVETAQTLNVDYTIVSDTVTYSTAPGAAYKVVIRRITPYTQEASWVAGSAPPLSAWESAFDKLTYLTQELNERLLRAPLTPSDSSVSSPTMPDPARYPGQYIRINSGGTNYEAIDLSGTLGAINITVLSDYADFNTMVSTIGTTEKTVFIDTVGTLSADITIPSTMHLIVLKGGIITLGNYDLTINGPFDAGRFQVFNCSGTGAVSGLSMAYPEWWGCDQAGATDAYDDFSNALASLSASGGVILGAPGATYLWSSAPSTGLTVTTSNLIIDGQGATIKGVAGASSKRFIYINGDSGTDGDWSSAVENTHVRNWNIGTANDANSNVLVLVARWTKNCSLENVTKLGFTNTSVTIQASQNFVCRNVHIYGSSTSNESIGILTHCSDNTLIDHCYIGDGAFIYGLQIKGGKNNTVRDCVINNVAAAGSVTPEAGFRDRGDAPWGASSTSGISYPWDTLSWTDADDRRASRGTRFINCSVVDAAVIAYVAQEDFEATWENCSYYNVNSGWGITRSDDADSDERDYTIINPRGEITTVGRGFDVNGQSSYRLSNVKIIGGRITTSYLDGFRCTYTDDLLIDGLTVSNSGQADADTYYGIGVLTTSLRPKIVNCHAYDGQGSATQDVGIIVDNTCYSPIVENNRAAGNISSQINTGLPGIYSNNQPAESVLQTTDATATTAWSMAMTNTYGHLVWLEATVIAEQSDGSNRAAYKVGGLYYCAAGTATLQGSVVDLITPIESDAAWACTLGVSGANVRVRVTGKAATTINWRVFVNCKPYFEITS